MFKLSAMLMQIATLLSCFCLHETLSFMLHVQTSLTAFSTSKEPIVGLNMAAGMGMGSNASKKKKQKKTKGGFGAGGGVGGSNGSSFDVSKSVLKSERLYDELLKKSRKTSDEDHKDFGTSFTSEYVIAARLNPNEKKDSIPAGAAALSDWIPVGQLILTRPIDSDLADESAEEKQRLSSAISEYCREINYMATLGSSLFKSIPRNLIQYSAEDIDSFYKFVYADVIEGKNSDEKNDNVMTKTEARKVLQLDEDNNDLAEIKKSYRKLSMKLHPDRFVGVERSEEEEDKTNEEFARVKVAYESLQSGIRVIDGDGNKSRSWYETLGGRERTDFIGPIELLSLDKAKDDLSSRRCTCAVAGLTPETVLAFVARNSNIM